MWLSRGSLSASRHVNIKLVEYWRYVPRLGSRCGPSPSIACLLIMFTDMLFRTAFALLGLQSIAALGFNSSEKGVLPRSSFKNYLAPEKSFEFTFECKHSNKTACSMAQAEIEHVGKLIGNELLFTRPAKVKVEFTYERKFYLGDSTYERIQIRILS